MEGILHSLKRFSTLLAPLVLLSFFCINRDNPWDPVNSCPEVLKREILSRQAPVIDSSLNAILSTDSLWNSLAFILDSISRINNSILKSNPVTAKTVDSLRKHNRMIDSLNRITTECSNIDTQNFLDTLDFLVELQDTQLFEECRKVFSIESLKIAALISSGNQECTPHGVYSKKTIDSIFAIIAPFTSKWDSLQKRWQGYGQEMRDSNRLSIDIFNRQVQIDNHTIMSYNRSRLMQIAYCGKELHSDPESLKTIIPSLQPGDTLYLDSIKITSQFSFLNVGDNEGPPIVVIGSPFMNTIISPAGFFLTESRNIRFYNLVFADGANSGVKLEFNCDRILFENCVFHNNSQHGVEAIQSNVELRNCIIYHNSGSGVRIQGTHSVEHGLVADNILVAHNRAYGINSISAAILLSNATISDNGLDGIRLEVANRPVTIARSLLTFNEYYGIRRDPSEPGLGFFTTPNTAFFGNKTGAMMADSVYLKLNEPFISEDPHYLNRDEDEYMIGPQSNLSGMDIGYSK